ncbi:hypothetical protein [Burkholderia sp. BCC0322]|uniref:hypothetical protein n=1 Tax=unclassified Burkholderia TaxID=2613784 RepID=UPI00158C60B1|nr:hypothetical protein [Burkholderia sp. BCC0322]
MTSRDELVDVLQDVRKAYRLLADYQSALLTLVNDIAREVGANYYTANYPNSPPRSYNLNPFGKRTGKHFLPMLGASYLFLAVSSDNQEPENNPEAGDFLLEFRLISDTNELEGHTPAPADTAESLLLVYIFQTRETLPQGTNWYHKIWMNTDYPTSDGGWHRTSSFESVRVSRLAINLAEFADPSAARSVARRILDHIETK